MELKLVVFDIDGTLVDSQNHITEAMALAFSGIGACPPARADVLSIVGLSLDQAMARLLPRADSTEIEALVEGYKSAFVDMRAARGDEGTAPLYPGARATIEALHSRPEVLLGAATGMARRGLDHIFEVHDLDRFFVTRQTADGHPSKPHPAMLQTALAETSVEASRAVMVGDTTYDIEMARAAGVGAIGVTWGYHAPAALLAAGAARVIDSFDALPGALAELWGEDI